MLGKSKARALYFFVYKLIVRCKYVTIKHCGLIRGGSAVHNKVLLINRKSENGFSFVELSVVLVLIGLLTAGVLGGKSLLRQSQLKTIVAEHNRFKAAYDTFKFKFNAIPGDFNKAVQYSLSIKNGDGDGILENLVYNSNGRTNEANNALIHMQRANILHTGVDEHLFGEYSWGILEKHFPRSTVDQNIGVRTTSAGGFYNGMASCPYYGKVDNINVLVYWGRVTNPHESQSLDNKFDDGSPDSGIMYASNGIGPPASSNYNVAGNRCVTLGLCHVGNPIYAVSETDNKRCYLMFSLGK